MNLEQFVANRDLLERLSREYELLKASGAEVDYPAWVRQRLREAALELAAPVAAPLAHENNTHTVELEAEPEATGTAQPAGEKESGAVTVTATGSNPNHEQLSLSRLPKGYVPKRPTHPMVLIGGGSMPGAPLVVRGEGDGPTSTALSSAIFGPRGPGSQARLKGTQSAKASGKRVVIVSPRKSPSNRHTGAAATHLRQPQQHVPVSKLYRPEELDLFSGRPDAYVHPEARPHRLTQAAQRPDWVNAASLQAALRGASAAAPHLQAAAERERRLALSTALARQTLAAGLGADKARAVALYGINPAAAATTQAAQYDHVLLVAQQLAQQNEHLARVLQANSEQLAQQQAVLAGALQQQQPHPDQPIGNTAPGAENEETAPRVEIETGPPGWFTRRGPGGSGRKANTVAAGTGKVGAALAHAGKAVTVLSSRPRNPPLPATATTTKERERANRKDALKSLLKQVLQGAGLAGGLEGRRRLVSGMEEAEKLVAAIQQLAQGKAGGKAGTGGGQTDEQHLSVPEPATRAPLFMERNLAATATQTSRGPSADGQKAHAAGGDGGLLPHAATQTSGPSRASSPSSLRRSQSPVSAPASRQATSAAPSRAASRQGSKYGTRPNSPGASAKTSNAPGSPLAAPPTVVPTELPVAGGPVGGRGLPPGVMVESLEDQVAQIVERDAAAYAEAARLRKLDALEQRLHSMVDKVETKLARALKPLTLNNQEQTVAGINMVGARLPGGQVPARDGAVATSSEQAAAGGACGEGSIGAVVNADSAGLSVLELQRMLIQLNRIESKEQEVRRKWFHDGKGPKHRAAASFGQQLLVVRDGQLGTVPPPGPSSPFARGPTGFPAMIQPPTESALAAAAAEGGRGAAVERQAMDPISEVTLESVLRWRRRFVRAQQLADGELLVASEPGVNPVQIMEDIADALLEEMLREQAQELTSLCDSLGEHLFEEELEIQDDKDSKLQSAPYSSGRELLRPLFSFQ